MKRYIVLGRARDVEAWRRERGLSRREVCVVSTREGHHAARGLSRGEYEIVRLDSWVLASAEVRAAVDANLDLMADIAGVAGYTLTYTLTTAP